MKHYTFLFTLTALIFLLSCNSQKDEKTDAYFESDDQFAVLQKSLKEQFSEDAGYQSIMLWFDERMGNTVSVKVARNIEDNNIEEWFLMNENWKKEAENKLEIKDKKVSDFLFTLNNDYNLSVLLDIVTKSKQKVEKEHNVKKAVCKSINLIMSKDRTSENKMDDLITQVTVEDAENGTTFKINFDAKGNLKN